MIKQKQTWDLTLKELSVLIFSKVEKMPEEGIWRSRKLLGKWELHALSCSQLCPWSVKLATEGGFHRRFGERVGSAADWRKALSAKSLPLASCCRYSCRAQIILSVWSGLHLFRTQPLCCHPSESSAECRRSERTGQREADGSNRPAVSPKLGLSSKKKKNPPMWITFTRKVGKVFRK